MKMRIISSMTSKFQILSNPFRIINSGKYCTGSMNTAENTVKKWEAGINEVRIMGRLDKDPWLTTVQGKPTLYLLVGIPEISFQKDGNKTTEQNFQTVYTQNSELIRNLQYYLRKGMRVYFCGQLSSLEDSNGKSINVRVGGCLQFETKTMCQSISQEKTAGKNLVPLQSSSNDVVIAASHYFKNF